MPRKKKNIPTKSYQFKLPRDERLQWFQALTTKAAQQLLDKLWSEEWINQLGKSNLKAYKVINEAQVELELNRQKIYLPSRIRRGTAEWAGRIIRGQYKRKNCYYDCLEIINWLGIETEDSKLIAIVMQYCRDTGKDGKTYKRYKKMLIRQTIEMIKNLFQRLGKGFAAFRYIDLVKPEIQHLAFPYSPDDGQTIQYTYDEEKINFKLKLPKTLEPKSKNDWQWIVSELAIPEKIQEKIAGAISSQPLKPTLHKKKLKGGLECFFLLFPWEFKNQPKRNDSKERVLAIDKGLKKVATMAIFEDGKQISKPITIKLVGSQYRHIERIYDHIAGNQHQIASQKKRRESKQIGVEAYQEERRRLYEKRNRLGEELAHTTTNILIQIALDWNCTKIVIEDLRDYKPPRGRRSWSRRLSQWLRGRIAFLLEYKCKEQGLTLQKVCPWNTSSHCPRCTAKGVKVLGPNNLIENKRAHWFHCPHCGFSADRDYIAAINIYRASFIDYKEIKSLKDTSPVPYMDSGIPHPTVLGGGSEMNCANKLVTVTGNG